MRQKKGTSHKKEKESRRGSKGSALQEVRGRKLNETRQREGPTSEIAMKGIRARGKQKTSLKIKRSTVKIKHKAVDVKKKA